MNTVRIVIVDDEKKIRTSLKSVIALHYPKAVVVAEAEDVQTAADIIRLHSPDVVLLDIEIEGGTGFDLLKQLMPLTFKVIFITAYNQYAIQAFKFSALDYLLKPVVPEELVNALQRAEEQLNEKEVRDKLNVLLNNISNLTHESKKIVINSQDHIHIMNIHDIVRCEADGNYTRFFLKDKSSTLSSHQLRDYDEMLNSFDFFRSHHSHLINLLYVDKINKRTYIILMKDGSEVPVSIRKYAELVDVFKRI